MFDFLSRVNTRPRLFAAFGLLGAILIGVMAAMANTLSTFEAQANAAVEAAAAIPKGGDETQMAAANAVTERIAAMAATADGATVDALMISIAALLLGAICAVVIARDVSEPLCEVSEALKATAAGDLDGEVPGGERGDEIGQIARDAAILRVKLREAEDLRAEREAARADAERMRMAAAHAAADGLDSAAGVAVRGVGVGPRRLAFGPQVFGFAQLHPQDR
ncbi:MAG: methyl-accepting chemotaxis protein, partial [Pseudomonadota bacterium]